jgi:tRNA (guanine37-N1)-methyltransferase
LVLDYDYWLAEDILQVSLPEGMEIPSSFEIVGHLAHLNLRDEQEPYGKLIGQVILDKNRALRTVVSKLGTIDTTFRFFRMQVLAGDDDTVVDVRQSGCRFQFDYSKVYWNSRLQFEHDRIVEMIKPGQVVCDVFCGVGPFAIPAAKKGAIVFANDLNPESYAALKNNVALNKIQSKGIHCMNMDGRETILNSQKLLSEYCPDKTHFDHYIMNLPALAVTFCSAFDEIAGQFEDHLDKIAIHVYLFVKAGEVAVDHLKANLKHPFTVEECRFVRTVAPNKDMYCISFKLTSEESNPSKKVKQSE